jgi:hypothetical protein
MSRAAGAPDKVEQQMISLVDGPQTDQPRLETDPPISVSAERSLSVSPAPSGDTALVDDGNPSVLLPIGSGRQPDLDHVRLVASTAIGEWLDGSPLRDIATLLVRELVTDAAWYGVPPFTLRMLPTDRGVRIEVQDAGQSPTTLAPPLDDAGSALPDEDDDDAALMDTLADRWGIQRRAAGRCLWFELSSAGLARANRHR